MPTATSPHAGASYTMTSPMRVLLDWFANGESPNPADQQILSAYLEKHVFAAGQLLGCGHVSYRLLPATRERLDLSPGCNQRLVLRALGMENWTMPFIVARILDEAEGATKWTDGLITRFGEESRLDEDNDDELLESEEEQG